MCKNEEDVLPWILEHLITQVDHVIVADNMSTDGTRPFLDALQEEHPDQLTIVDDPVVAYMQSQKMTMLARKAHHEFNADWIIPFDADEFWYSPFGCIKDVLAEQAPQWLVAPAHLYNHITTDLDPLEESNPLRRIGWRSKTPASLHKVACRFREDLVIQQGNHGALYDGGGTVIDGLLVVRHFPYRSAEQFAKKAIQGAAAYAATDLPESEGAHWRSYGRLADANGVEVLHSVYREWFHIRGKPDLEAHVYDPAVRYV